MADKYTIIIPKTVEHTKVLECLVEPPHDKMTIDLCNEGSTTPFLRGGIANRRCPSIDAFVKRPIKLNLETRQRDKPLVKGDKIDVIVTLWGKVANPVAKGDKPTFTEEIQKVKETVTIS